ncbi:MAG: TonB-dependent receptor domain-containing protein, partial [Candidatus Binatia bacterium]
WLDGLLTANLSVFHNDWKDLQVLTTEEASVGGVPTALSAVLNVAEAFSRGVELELAALPTDRLTLGFNVAIMEGEISQGDPAGTIPDGSPLPQLSELSYAASADYELLDWSFFGLSPVMHFDTQRVGDRFLSPPGTLPGPELDGFQLYGAMVGLVSDRWDFTFGVRNLTDARPEIGANLLELDTKTIGPPRTWTATCAFRW